MLRRVCVLTVLTLASLCGAWSSAAHARGSLAVMSLRVAPGVVSTRVFLEANNLLWQQVSASPGVAAVSESQLAAQVGPGA